MPTYRERSILSGMTVGQAMQKIVTRLAPDTGITDCIRYMIKFKSDAALVSHDKGPALGVVSKTDIMGAFYGGLPVETRVKDIMMGPVRVCAPEEGIDAALDEMNGSGIHQLYVKSAKKIVGTLEFSDIVGLMYRYCRNCQKGRRRPGDLEQENLPRLKVTDVMTKQVAVCNPSHSLYQVMDLLSVGGIKAVPVTGQGGKACGIISKTDLALAYARGTEPKTRAREIMNSPLVSSGPDASLSNAILQMFLNDVGHLFVLSPETQEIIGVVSLSDAARFRSGTCKACSASRIL